MLFFLLLPLLLPSPAAHAGRDKQKGKERDDAPSAEVPAVAEVPAATLPPKRAEAHPLPVPQLFGPDAVLALEGLTRVQIGFTFETDLSALKDLGPAGIDSVFTHLAADPRWRVTRSPDGTRVATQRFAEADPPTIAQSGYHLSQDHCWRVALRDGGSDPGGWVRSERVSHATPDATAKIDLSGFRPDGGLCGKLATAVLVSGPLSLEVFESGPDDARPTTLAALGEVPFLIANLTAMRGSVLQHGFDVMHMPPGEPVDLDDPTLALSAAGEQALSVVARVDPGAPGFTWLRLLDAGGAPWHETELAVGTLERVGYSTEDGKGFLFQSIFGAPSGEAFSGVAELWFQPDGGEAPQRLHAQRLEVPAR